MGLEYFPSAPDLDNFMRPDREGRTMMNSALPLGEYVQVWLSVFKRNSVKPATYDRLVTSAAALNDFDISDKPICEISFFDIQRYINELVEEGYSLSTIKKQVLIVTAPLKQAAAMHVLASDPSCGIRLPSQHNVRKKPRETLAYTPEDQEKLLRVIRSEDRAGYLCVALMMETGLRAGEALALGWKNVDIPRKRLRVTATVVNLANKKQSYIQDSPKSISSIRTVPLTPRAVDILLRAKELSEDEWVFSGGKDRLSYEALRYQTRLLCKKAGVTYHGEHIFRHTFATNCYYKGMDIKILSKILGHSDTSVTYNVYINLYGDAFDEMYAAMNG